MNSKRPLCDSATSENVLTRREQSPDDVKPKILDLKVELDSLPSEPDSTENNPEMQHRRPCSGEIQDATDAKRVPLAVADSSDCSEAKPDDQECRTCVENSEVTSEASDQGFRTSTKTEVDLMEVDSSVLPPKLEQSCGPADGMEQLAASEQHQDSGLATSGLT